MIFIFLLVCSPPVILIKMNKINEKQGQIIFGSICIIFIIVYVKNFLKNRYNSVSDVNTQLWVKPDVQAFAKKESANEKRKRELLDRLKNMKPLSKLEFMLSEKKNQAVDNDNFSLAGHYNNQLKFIATNVASGYQFGGYRSDEAILAVIEELKSDEVEIKAKMIEEIDTATQRVEQNIKMQELEMEEMMSKQKNNTSGNEEIQAELTAMQNKLKFQKDQLNKFSSQKDNLKNADKDTLKGLSNSNYGEEDLDAEASLKALQNFAPMGK